MLSNWISMVSSFLFVSNCKKLRVWTRLGWNGLLWSVKIIFCQPFLVSWWAEELIDTHQAMFFLNCPLGPLGWVGLARDNWLGTKLLISYFLKYPFLDSWRAHELIDTHHAVVSTKSQKQTNLGWPGHLGKALLGTDPIKMGYNHLRLPHEGFI